TRPLIFGGSIRLCSILSPYESVPHLRRGGFEARPISFWWWGTGISREPSLRHCIKEVGNASTTSNVSVPLHPIAVGRLRALCGEPRATRSKYCSGSRCLGGWFWLEGRLRHSCQGWLQCQHRPRAGDIL